MNFKEVNLVVKKHRLTLAAKTLQNLLDRYEGTQVADTLEKCVKPMLEHRLASLNQGEDRGEKKVGCEKKVLVASSGGVDSTASLLIAFETGLKPVAVTLKLPWGDSRPLNLEKFCEQLGIPLKTLGCTEEHLELFHDAQRRGYHPCGRCHSLLVGKLHSYATDVGADMIGFGNMLPTGTHAIRVVGESLVHVNIPALLALDKREALAITGFTGQLRYGCNFLGGLHKKHRYTRRVSLQRVFRELRAGCIDVEIAEQFVWSILSA